MDVIVFIVLFLLACLLVSAQMPKRKSLLTRSDRE
jgi:hypothetical protein